jgi:hypothetical protein
MKQAARVKKLQDRIRSHAQDMKRPEIDNMKKSLRCQTGGYKCPGSYK